MLCVFNHFVKIGLPLLSLLSTVTLDCNAQTEPMYTQYIFNALPLNPAYAGSHENLSISGIFRKQWWNMDGAPSTQTISAHSPLQNKNVALGITVLHDRIGVTSRGSIMGVYAYKISFRNNSKLSFGLQGGVNRNSLKLSRLQTKMAQDPAASLDRVMYTLPGFGAGVYWYSEKYFLGASIPDMVELRSKKASGEIIHYRHLFVMMGYVFKLSSQVQYVPGILLKGVNGTQLQFDLNNIFVFHDVLWAGISYRHKSSLNFILQAQLSNQFSMGYSYDLPASEYSRTAGPSHEFKINYRFVFFKDNAYMPRYF